MPLPTHLAVMKPHPPSPPTTTVHRTIAILALLALTPILAAYVDPASGKETPRRVLRAFEKPEHNWLPGHRGVNLDLETGAEVRAAGSGTVAFAGSVAGRPSISIDHPDGLRSTYTPVFSRVSVGEKVQEGDIIGTLSAPVDGEPGLHWGVLQGKDDYLNPLSLLKAPVIRLKPL